MSPNNIFPITTPMDYTPQTPQAQPPSQATYDLTTDGTGKAPENRGPITLIDRNNQQVTLPYPPKNSCNKCYGRGYVGHFISKNKERNGRFLLCTKCYPMLRGKS